MSTRSEPATPKKLKRSRALGDIPSAPQLAQALVLCASACVLPAGVKALAAHSAAQLKGFLRTGNVDVSTLQTETTAALSTVAAYSLPPLAIAALAQLAVRVIEARSGGTSSIATPRAGPTFRFRNPLSWQGILVTVTSWLVAVALIAHALVWLRYNATSIVSTLGNIYAGLRLLQTATLRLLWFSCATWATVGALGFVLAYRLWLWRNRMSREEKQQEQKESEGDPSITAELTRLRHQQLSESVQLQLNEATLVIHHASRVAVFLKYDASSTAAPRVVGVGRSNLLGSILAEAQRLEVPVVEHASLARALADGTVGEAIAESLYSEVAEILAAIQSAAIGH